ncbi:MAG: ABC transporter permease [Vicinamibacterales bacterium]
MARLTSLRLAARNIWRRPRPIAAMVLLLSVAWAIFAAVTSIVDGVLLRPPPFPSAKRIVHLDAPVTRYIARPDVMARIQAAVSATTRLGQQAWVARRQVFASETGLASDTPVTALFVSPGFFRVFGVTPILGRTLNEADGRADPVPVLVSQRIWLTRFGGDAAVLGRPIRWPDVLDQATWTIVGVLPDGPTFPGDADVWLPYGAGRFLPTLVPTFALLDAGVSIEQLQRDLPDITITPLREYLRPTDARSAAFVWLASVCLLVAATAQVATLLASILAGRLPDMAVKRALGADDRSLEVEWLSEMGLVALASLLATVILARPTQHVLVSLFPAELTSGLDVSLGPRVAILVMIVCAVTVSALAVQGTRRLRRSRQGLRPRMAGRSRSDRPSWRAVSAQVALSVLVLHAAALVVQSHAGLLRDDLGFEPEDLLAVPMPAPPSLAGLAPSAGRSLAAEHARRVRESLEAVRRVDGVRRAAFASAWPMAVPVEPQAMRVGTRPGVVVDVVRLSVSPDHVRTIGATLISGREPTADEAASLFEGPSRAVVVNRTLAALLEPFGPVVGQTLSSSPARVYEITGVIDDIALDQPGPTPPMAWDYVPAGNRVLLVRAAAGRIVGPRVLEALGAVWQDDAPRRVVPLHDVAARRSAGARASAVLVSTIAAACALLTAMGVATNLARQVDEEGRALAIRLALGASGSHLRRWLVRAAVPPVAAGVATGLLAGFIGASVVRAAFWGVTPSVTLAAVTGGIVIAAAAWAGVWPAYRRAIRCDPAVLLR